MELCNIEHEEVCYESWFCPACAVREKMQEKLDRLQDENDDLKRTIEENAVT